MSSDFLKKLGLALAGIIGGLIVAAYVLQYGSKYVRRGLGFNANVAAATPSSSPSLLVIVGVLTGITLIVWGLLYAFRPVSGSNLSPAKGDLSVKTTVGTRSQVYNGFYRGTGGGGSFGTYVYLNNYDRTPRSAASATPLISIGAFNLYVHNSNNLPHTTYAVVNLKNNNNNTYNVLPLDEFPLQKWVYVTVNREGRRFTVYYNGVIAGSKVFDQYYSRVTDAVKIGGAPFIGRFLYPNINETVMREADIQAYIRTTADSKGQPIEKQDFFEMLLSGGGSIFCSGGSCAKPAYQAPSGYRFSTPFQ
jgi:hypothetical protein